MTDVIIVGAGIAGASSAWQLKKSGMNVLVLEKSHICSGGSAAAGAFLSPKISKPGPYKAYLNTALSYSLKLYETHFSDLLHKNGLYKLPLDEEDMLRCVSYEPYIDIAWQKRQGGYFFPDAGIIDPRQLCRRMLEGITTHDGYHVRSIRHDGDVWIVNDTYRARYLILATGSDTNMLPLAWLRRKKIGGYRYDVRFDGMGNLAYNMHKDISISTYLPETDKVIIGATHIRKPVDLQHAAEYDSYRLIEKAQEMMRLPNLQRLASYSGYRSFSFDYFPILGAVVDAEKTLKTYPYIQKGTRVPFERYCYYPNLFIHTALGSRGFVFAPYNAMLLTRSILQKGSIDPPLLPATRFRKWAQRQSKIV